MLYQALKSIRTAFVIGTLATIATLPFAVVLGVLAGLLERLGRRGDPVPLHDARRRCPNVLLIAACVLMVQVYLDKHPEMFETGAERSDVQASSCSA